ncbi:MAG: hypothetical protein K8R92_06040 [Planctomycetes bacterium]|nr:hypothetical protein [Planctomycetota bacterium]
MNTFKIAATVACLAASSSFADVYVDAENDLFDNGGLANLDISSVSVTNDASSITFAVTTRGFASWSKFMILIRTAGNGDGSNAWSRPINQNGGNANHFIGSWIDQPTDNSQNVAFNGGGWDWGGSQTFTNSVSGNTVSWTVSLASLGLSAGDHMYFDVATSGGGNDPGVDHLSRATAATSGWGEASTAGEYLDYRVVPVPTPGAIALVGLAGLLGKRRRA